MGNAVLSTNIALWLESVGIELPNPKEAVAVFVTFAALTLIL